MASDSAAHSGRIGDGTVQQVCWSLWLCFGVTSRNRADRPIGVVLWAFFSDDVEQRLMSGTMKLRPQDWKSGDKVWVIEVIAPFGGGEEMVKDLKSRVFPNDPVHYMAVSADGKKERKVV